MTSENSVTRVIDAPVETVWKIATERLVSRTGSPLDHANTGALYTQNRSMEARMASADLVHRNGFGSALF